MRKYKCTLPSVIEVKSTYQLSVPHQVLAQSIFMFRPKRTSSYNLFLDHVLAYLLID